MRSEKAAVANIAAKQIGRDHVEYRCPYCSERHREFLENKGKPIIASCALGRIRFVVLPKVEVFPTIGDVKFRLLSAHQHVLVTPTDRVIRADQVNAWLKRNRQIDRIA